MFLTLFTNNVLALDPPSTGNNLAENTDIPITITRTKPDTNDVEHWSEIAFKLDFFVNPGTAKNANEGDYILVDWPQDPGNAAFTPHSNLINLEKDGEVFATAEITHEGVLIVFTDVIERKYDVEGEVNIVGRITKSDTSNDNTETFTIKLNGEAKLEFTVHPSDSVITGSKDLEKYGENSGEEKILTWNLRINEDFEDTFTGDASLIDNLGTGHEIIEDTIYLQEYRLNSNGDVMSIEDYYNSLNNTNKNAFLELINHLGYTLEEIGLYPIAFCYTLDGSEMDNWFNDGMKYLVFQARDENDLSHYYSINDYLSPGSLTLNDSKTRISMVIPDNKINNHFLQLIYQTEITSATTDLIYDNEVEFTFSKNNKDSETVTDEKEIKYDNSSGSITGLDYRSIKVTKIDSENELLAGIYFEITTGSDPVLKYVAATDEHGILQADNLIAGTYYVRELSEEEAKQFDPSASYPKHLVIDPTIYEVTIGTSAETTINHEFTVTNTYQEYSSLSISKKLDGDDISADDVFEFEIILSDDTLNGTYSDVEFTNGKATIRLKGNETKLIEKLPVNITYEVNELENDLGYTPSCDSNTGTLLADEVAEVIYTNTKNKKEVGSISIKKLLAGNKVDPDKNFNFELSLSDTSINGTYGDLTFIDGVAEFILKGNEIKLANNLPIYLTYKVIEIEADKDGYVTTIENDSGTIVANQTIEVIFTNTKNEIKTKIKFSKQDVYGYDIFGASLKLKNEAGELIEEWISDGTNKKIELLPGNYILDEISAPFGYQTISEFTFSIDENNEIILKGLDSNSEIEYDEDNNIIIIKDSRIDLLSEKPISILKVDENEKPLENAILQILHKEDNGYNVLEEFETSENPSIIYLQPGEYYLKEKQAPEGYKLIEDLINFTINDDYSITLNSNNALVSSTNIRIILKNIKESPEEPKEPKTPNKPREVVNTSVK